jgi:hypothetical protein
MRQILTGSLIALVLAVGLGCNCLCSNNDALVVPLPLPKTPARLQPGEPWQFAVSGDSRNCGDVIMPAIAQGADRDHAQFYWHLGDLRAIYDFDEDIKQRDRMEHKHMSISQYEDSAWDDFRRNQVKMFGDIPFFLGIGNHETVEHLKDRTGFVKEFSDLLNRDQLKAQRQSDGVQDQPGVPPKTYYHWVVDGIDFIYLDNATPDEFDADQMQWFKALVGHDEQDTSPIRTVVVGMHEALPNSFSDTHSMNQQTDKGASGEEVYRELLELQKKRKVYVLASHSHYYMEDIFDTPYWQKNGGVLPGWIVGTAGAHRYPLPKAPLKNVAKTNVYGYLLGTANPPNQPPGTVTFTFKQLEESEIPLSIIHDYTEDFVHWCFVENTDAK